MRTSFGNAIDQTYGSLTLVYPGGAPLGGALNVSAGAGIVGGVELAGNGAVLATGSLFVGMGTTGISQVLARGAQQLQIGVNAGNQINVSSAGAIAIAATTTLALSSTGANTTTIATNGVTRMTFGTGGANTIAAPTSGVALTINGDGANSPLSIVSGGFGRAILMDSTIASGTYFQLTNSGTNLAQLGSSNILFSGTLADFGIRSQANFVLGTVTAGIIFTLASAGNVTLAAPNSGIGLTVNGFSGTHSMKHADSAAALFNTGYLEVPQNLQAGTTYTAVLADSGKQITGSNAGAKTFTIPANASVAYPIGTVLTFVCTGAGSMTIAITTDTMNLSPVGTTGSRTLVQFGIATAVKVAATTWYISGSGLT